MFRLTHKGLPSHDKYNVMLYVMISSLSITFPTSSPPTLPLLTLFYSLPAVLKLTRSTVTSGPLHWRHFNTMLLPQSPHGWLTSSAPWSFCF